MSRKTKINVLLPFKMVGELERYSKQGIRSQFIERAIRNRLDQEETFDIADVPTRQLMAVLLARLQKREDAAANMMCTFILGELQ